MVKGIEEKSLQVLPNCTEMYSRGHPWRTLGEIGHVKGSFKLSPADARTVKLTQPQHCHVMRAGARCHVSGAARLDTKNSLGLYNGDAVVRISSLLV